MKQSECGMQRVGYIGLGNMGGGIATHLVRAGVPLFAYDTNPDAVQKIVAEGGKAAESLRQITEDADILVVCVLDSAQVLDVVAGENGILQHCRPGQVVIIQSTVIPQTILRLADAAKERGVDLIDAPVSGSFEDRLNGTLAVIVGGDAAVVERCRPLLETIGNKVRHVGPLGSAEVAKLANNAIMHTTRLAAIEAMRFAAAYGVTEDMVRAVAKVCSADSWVLDHWAYFDAQTKLAIGDDAPQIRDALEAAGHRDVDLPLCRAAAGNAPAIESGRRHLLQGTLASAQVRVSGKNLVTGL